MGVIGDIINWIKLHWADIVQIYLQIIGVASIVVQLTPTLRDDNILKAVIKFIGKYVALNTSKGSTPK